MVRVTCVLSISWQQAIKLFTTLYEACLIIVSFTDGSVVVCISKQNKLNVNVLYSKQITFACVCGGGEMIIPCLTYFQLVAAQALDNR